MKISTPPAKPARPVRASGRRVKIVSEISSAASYRAPASTPAKRVSADMKRAASGKIPAALELLLSAGVAEGTLRADVDVEDVRGMSAAVWQIDDADRARRMLRVLMDGLRVVRSDDTPLK